MERNKLVIIGAGGHGKVVLDIAQCLNRYEKYCFVDDAVHGSIDGAEVIGTMRDLLADDALLDSCEVVVAVGNADTRERIVHQLPKVHFATLVHPTAVVAKTAVLQSGTVVMANAVINADAVIGQHCIINTGAIVEHDDRIGDYCHISVGARLAGTVQIGDHSWIGIAAVVSNNISICSHCLIGAGAVVVKDITETGTYVGVPARKDINMNKPLTIRGG